MLDTIDFYINFVMLIIGFFETFSVGWIYGIEEQISKFGSKATVAHIFANFGAVILACAFWFGIDHEDHAIWSGFLVLVVIYGVGFYMSVYYVKQFVGAQNYSSSTLFDFTYGNIFEYKAELEPVIGYVPSIWCYLVKQLIPQVLVIIFINLARSKNKIGESQFGHYGEYKGWPYQVLGVASFCFALAVIIGAFFFPDAYAPFVLPTAAPAKELPQDEGVEVEYTDKKDGEIEA